MVDVHAFTPERAAPPARARAGFDDVRVRGEELLANWFGWANRALEATRRPGRPCRGPGSMYAFRGYIGLQQRRPRAARAAAAAGDLLQPDAHGPRKRLTRRDAAGRQTRRHGRARRDFPLFPLGLVALPTEIVPLHIFEDRYKAMIDECLERRARVRDRLGRRRRAARPTAARWRSPRCSSATTTGAWTSSRAARGRSGSSRSSTTSSTRPATIEFLDDKRRGAPTTPTAEAAHEAYGELVERGDRPRARARGARAADRLRDGGDRRLRARRQAGAARPALRERAPAARDAAVPRRRSSGWTSSSARRRGRGRTGRSASAEAPRQAGRPPGRRATSRRGSARGRRSCRR